MQLRTVKKPKNKAYDFGWSGQGDQTVPRKNSVTKDSVEKEGNISENEVLILS